MTLDEIRRFFEDTDNILLTTHESPDGDGLGAEYALCVALSSVGKRVMVLNAEEPAAKYGFLDKRNLIRTLGLDGDFPENLESWTLVVLDTDPTNIGNLADVALRICKDVVVLDHHKPKKTGGEFRGWLVPSYSSTCEMIFHLIEAMDLEIEKDIAVALYTGIVYDTGSFVYPKTQARTFRIAETLVNSGAVPNEIFTQLYESKSAGALICQSLVTSTLILHEEDSVGVQVMPRETLIASGAEYEEIQEIVNIPLQCAKVRVSVFLKENKHGTRRCSLRSKGKVDCAAIAHSFGGGGHKTAAGFKFEGSFVEIQEKILDAIRVYLT